MGPLIVNGSPGKVPEKELISLAGQDLKRVIYKELELPVEANRQLQISMARKSYLYMDGKQYLAPQMSPDGRSWDWKPVEIEEKDGKKRKFASVYNIVYADGVKFVAVVGQRPPNVKAVPEDPMLAQHVGMASDADTAALFLHKQWNIRRRMKEVAFYLWSTGPVFFHTRFISSATKYGTTSVPNIEFRQEQFRAAGIECTVCGTVAEAQECPACSAPLNPLAYQGEIVVEVPYQNGVKTYPKGAVELGLKTIFEVGVPFGARTLDECEWLTHDEMETEWRMRSMYNLEGLDITGSDNERGSVADAQHAKEMIESPNGVACYDRANGLVLHSRKYIRPEIYHALPPNLRKSMQENCPDGALIVIAGTHVVSITNQKMDEHWAVCKTGTGPKIVDPPLCTHVLPIQDDINDFNNMGKETILRGIPKTLVASDLLDPSALKENEGLVGEMLRVKLGTNQSIGNLMGQLPTARMSDQMLPFGASLREFSREIDGVQPAIYGGGTPANTFRAENQRKNQALMQLQPPFEEMHEAVRQATKNGIIQLARFGSGSIKVTSKDPMVPTRHLQLETLQEIGWDIEAEESTPVSLGEKQERVSAISQENPELAAVLGFSHPMNVAEMQRMFGVDNLYTPGVMQLKKAMATIATLLVEQPIEDIDPMTGQPVMIPSRMPDPYEFKDAAFMSQVFHAWVLSDSGQQFSTISPQGFENVKLFGQQLDIMAMPPAPPMPVEGGQEPPSQGQPQSPMPPPPGDGDMPPGLLPPVEQ